MTASKDLLTALEAQRGQYVSGEELARRLGVTRSAIWKAAQGLRQEGYAIEATTNLGYRLSDTDDLLSVPGIQRHLPEDFPVHLQVHKVVDSTNLIAKRLGSAGEPEWTVVVAGAQTAGRGRLGRSFLSPMGTGIYMSILLRPDMHASESLFLTSLAAVAVTEAIESVTGEQSGIKWVNDIFLRGKKVCGILTEASVGLESGGLECAIVGIGINVYTPEGGFPEELKDIAGSLFPEGSPTRAVRNRLTAEVLTRFRKYYSALPERTFLEAYRNKSILLGKLVTVNRGNASWRARVLGIDDACRLIVEDESGNQMNLQSGEVSVRL